jgi:hypothetical protein
MKGTIQPVYWHSKGFNNLKLDYSIDNKNWTTLCDSVNGKNGFTSLSLPNIQSNNVILKATDLEDDENKFYSQKFNLISQQLWGGPYSKDDKTILLMHFENELSNEANNQLIPNELNPIGIYEENYNKNLGKAFRVFNPNNQTADAIHLKNSESLDLGNNWTIEAWVQVSSIMGERTVASLIINKWDAFNISAGWQHFGAYIGFENGSSVEFYHPEEYNLNDWYHVSLISNATEEKVYFYVNDKNCDEIYKNVKDFPVGSNGEIRKNENIVTIGGLGGGSNLELDGYLDELRITKDIADYQSMLVGINDKITIANHQLAIFPNPITDESIISFNTKTSGKVDLSIYDLKGRKISTLLNANLAAGKHRVLLENVINISGVYLCKLATSEGVSTLKLIY